MGVRGVGSSLLAGHIITLCLLRMGNTALHGCIVVLIMVHNVMQEPEMYTKSIACITCDAMRRCSDNANKPHDK